MEWNGRSGMDGSPDNGRQAAACAGGKSSRGVSPRRRRILEASRVVRFLPVNEGVHGRGRKTRSFVQSDHEGSAPGARPTQPIDIAGDSQATGHVGRAETADAASPMASPTLTTVPGASRLIENT